MVNAICPFCGRPGTRNTFRVRTRQYLAGRRQRIATASRSGLCNPCAHDLLKQRALATLLGAAPAILFSCFGFGKVSLVVLGCNLVYTALYGRYTWADHLLFGKRLIPKLDAEFAELGDGDKSLPGTSWLALLRFILAAAIPIAVAIAWVTLFPPPS